MNQITDTLNQANKTKKSLSSQSNIVEVAKSTILELKHVIAEKNDIIDKLQEENNCVEKGITTNRPIWEKKNDTPHAKVPTH